MLPSKIPIGGTWPSGDAIGVGSTDGRTQVFAIGIYGGGTSMSIPRRRRARRAGQAGRTWAVNGWPEQSHS
jgi:hypothetical protein